MSPTRFSAFPLALLVGCALPTDFTSNTAGGVAGDGGSSELPYPSDWADDDDDASVDELQAAALIGRVVDPHGAPLHNVRVTTHAGHETWTDSLGIFRFTEIRGEGRLLIDFFRPGYARTQVPYIIRPGTASPLEQRMAPVDVTSTFDSSQGAHIAVEDGSSVSIPADAWVDGQGNPYSGSVTVQATWFDVYSPEGEGGELTSTPGDMSGQDEAGEVTDLESWGMMQVQAFDPTGGELELNGSAPMQLSFPIPQLEGRDQPPVDTYIAAWFFNQEQGLWDQDGGGWVEQEDGDLFWTADVQQTGSWNADDPLETVACVTGCLVDDQGQPLPDVFVRFLGLDYVGTTFVTTEADGCFCMPVNAGGQGYFEYELNVGGQMITQFSEPLDIPDQDALCVEEEEFVWQDFDDGGGDDDDERTSPGDRFAGIGLPGATTDGDVHFGDDIDGDDVAGLPAPTDPASPKGPALQWGDLTTTENGCLDLGEVVLSLTACVHGLVLGPDGEPLQGQEVFSPQGDQQVTRADGTFDMTLPVFGAASFYAVHDAQQAWAWEPISINPIGGPGTGQQCPNQVVLQPYADTGCAAGSLQVPSNNAAGVPVHLYDPEFPDAPLFTSLTDSNGGFCLQAPVLERTLRLAVGESDLLCAEAAVDPAGPAECGSGACEMVGNLSCQ